MQADEQLVLRLARGDRVVDYLADVCNPSLCEMSNSYRLDSHERIYDQSRGSGKAIKSEERVVYKWKRRRGYKQTNARTSYENSP